MKLCYLITNQNKLCCQDSKTKPLWLPSVADFLESLIGVGASPSIVSTIQDHHPNLDATRFESLDCSGEEQFVDARATRKFLYKRCYTVQFIVKFFSVCIQTSPSHYSVEELRGMFVVACHLSVEKLYQLILFDVKIMISSILEAFAIDTWEDHVRDISISCQSFLHFYSSQ